MRRSLRSVRAALSVAALCPFFLHAQGLLVHDATTAGVLPILETTLHVQVEDQIAQCTSTQHFVNNGPDTLVVRYAYPLAETASATSIRWALADSVWHTAVMIAAPQDTVLPGSGGGGGGGGVSQALDTYLGETPLYFTIPVAAAPGAELHVELSYVQLLPYANARVELLSASDYDLVLNGTLPHVLIDVQVRSQRALTGMDIAGLGNWSPVMSSSYLTTDSARIVVEAVNVPVSDPFAVGYDLDPLAYGLTALSNYLPDSLVKCDALDNGFFALLIEPEPTSEVVNKDFVIVIDNSGSMSGAKIQDARAAATYMVQHLNAGDRFNVIKFNSTASSWNADLQPVNASTTNAALNWINGIAAGGGTSINTAITMGMQDFTTAAPGSARMMVFLTDGQDSESNNVILTNATNLRQSIVPDLQLFTFGIGSGYNQQLLNQLAVQNNGVSQFLQTADFLQVMNDFYLQIQNPVLLNPVATFSNADVVATYPSPLVGLFVGQQMVIVGRYDTPGPVNLHLAGVASGQPVSFDYPIDFAGTFDPNKLFIPKVWAQYAVVDLMNEYYGYALGGTQANMIRDSVVSFSVCYGIGSPFTSFIDPGNGGGGGSVEVEELERTDADRVLVFPEPSIAGQPITIDLSDFTPGTPLIFRLYDGMGRIILEVDLRTFSGQRWTWDGLDATGKDVKGMLFFTLSDGQTTRTGRLTRM